MSNNYQSGPLKRRPIVRVRPIEELMEPTHILPGNSSGTDSVMEYQAKDWYLKPATTSYANNPITAFSNTYQPNIRDINLSHTSPIKTSASSRSTYDYQNITPPSGPTWEQFFEPEHLAVRSSTPVPALFPLDEEHIQKSSSRSTYNYQNITPPSGPTWEQFFEPEHLAVHNSTPVPELFLPLDEEQKKRLLVLHTITKKLHHLQDRHGNNFLNLNSSFQKILLVLKKILK